MKLVIILPCLFPCGAPRGGHHRVIVHSPYSFIGHSADGPAQKGPGRLQRGLVGDCSRSVSAGPLTTKELGQAVGGGSAADLWDPRLGCLDTCVLVCLVADLGRI